MLKLLPSERVGKPRPRTIRIRDLGPRITEERGNGGSPDHGSRDSGVTMNYEANDGLPSYKEHSEIPRENAFRCQFAAISDTSAMKETRGRVGISARALATEREKERERDEDRLG